MYYSDCSEEQVGNQNSFSSDINSENASEYQDIIYDKYIKKTIKTFKFVDEIKDYLYKNSI